MSTADRSLHTDATSVMRRMLDAFAAGETDVVEELCAPDLVEHQFGMTGVGVEAISNLKAASRELRSTVPDISIAIEDAVESGDTVWVRAHARGTAAGPFFGPPSGRPVDVTVIDIARVVDGRIVEHWGVPDRFAMLVQTGVLERLARGNLGTTGADPATR